MLLIPSQLYASSSSSTKTSSNNAQAVNSSITEHIDIEFSTQEKKILKHYLISFTHVGCQGTLHLCPVHLSQLKKKNKTLFFLKFVSLFPVILITS